MYTNCINGYYIEDNSKPVYKIVGRVKTGLILLERLTGMLDDRFDFYSDENIQALILFDGFRIVYYGKDYISIVNSNSTELNYFLAKTII